MKSQSDKIVFIFMNSVLLHGLTRCLSLHSCSTVDVSFIHLHLWMGLEVLGGAAKYLALSDLLISPFISSLFENVCACVHVWCASVRVFAFQGQKKTRVSSCL